MNNKTKSDRIKELKKLIENNQIFFDNSYNSKLAEIMIHYDFGSGKDYYRKHIFYNK